LFWCSSRDQYFSRSTGSQSLKVVRPYFNIVKRRKEEEEITNLKKGHLSTSLYNIAKR
jgi:hypothetical protein